MMLREQKNQLFLKISEVSELKTVRTLSPQMFDENGRLTGITHYPAAVLIFDGYTKEYNSSNSSVIPIKWQLWIATLHMRGKEEKQQDEIFELVELAQTKLEEIPNLQIKSVRRVRIFGDVLVYAVNFELISVGG